MRLSVRIAVVLSASLACLAAASQSPVGTWSGKIDASQAKPKDDGERQMLAAMKPMLGQFRAKLVVKADHTYSAEFTGDQKGGTTKESGKWSQSGQTVTITDPKGKTQKLVMSSNGKIMINTPGPEDHMPAGIKLVFTRK